MTMMFRRICYFLAISAVATAFSTNGKKNSVIKAAMPSKNAFAAAAALAFVLAGDPQQALATSSTAGQISLNSIPPTSIKIDVRDLPIVGDLISGTYTKVADGSISSPSVNINSPKDKLNAIKAAATGGHLEFDIKGLLSSHLDVDIATNEAGLATVKVASPLIPKLPFKNSASSDCVKATGKKTDWYKVVNLGTGDAYYYNEETGVSQLELPAKLK
jgi:hypothetical protein